MIWYLVGLVIGLSPLLIGFICKSHEEPIEDYDYTSKILEDLKLAEKESELERLRMKVVALETYREMEERKKGCQATQCCGIEFLYQQPRKAHLSRGLELPE